MRKCHLHGLLGSLLLFLIATDLPARMMGIAYLVGDGGNAIFRFASDGGELESITTTGGARALAYGDDGTLYYTSSTDSSGVGGLYRVVDTTHSDLLFTAPALTVDTSGTSLDVSSSGEIAFLVGDGGNAIFRFGADGTFVDAVTTTGAARALAFADDGTLFYTSSTGLGGDGGLYRVVDADTSIPLNNALALAVDTGASSLDVSPSGEIAYLVGDGGNAIFRFADDGTFVDAVTTTGAARGLAYDDDGTLYYTSSTGAGGDGGLYRVVDATTSVLLSAAPALAVDTSGTDLDVAPTLNGVPEPTSACLMAGVLCVAGGIGVRRRRAMRG